MEHGIETVGVVGAGQMGHGIAEVCMIHGFKVRLFDASYRNLEAGVRNIYASLVKLEEKGKLTESAGKIMTRLSWGWSIQSMADCDLVIEAATENSAVKIKIFRELHEICPRNTIFATNTSVIPIGWMANALGSKRRSNNITGLHFMNPPVFQKLVEVIRVDAESSYGHRTSDRTYKRMLDFVKAIGRSPIIESRDETGFILNFMLVPLINRAADLVERGERLEHVNTLVLGVEKAMPVLDLADFIGLDIVLSAVYVLQKYPKLWIKPSSLLAQMVEQGKLGRKTGEGFFKYDREGRKIDG